MNTLTALAPYTDEYQRGTPDRTTSRRSYGHGRLPLMPDLAPRTPSLLPHGWTLGGIPAGTGATGPLQVHHQLTQVQVSNGNDDPPGIQPTSTRGGDLNSNMAANADEARKSTNARVTATSSRGGDLNSAMAAAQAFEARCTEGGQQH